MSLSTAEIALELVKLAKGSPEHKQSEYVELYLTFLEKIHKYHEDQEKKRND